MSIIIGIIYFFSMFFATPKLSSNNQDTEIKNNALRMLGAVHEFIANNNGYMPTATDFDQLMVQYSIKDPSTGQLYTSNIYFPGQNCDGSRKTRAVSVKVRLTDGSELCVD